MIDGKLVRTPAFGLPVKRQYAHEGNRSRSTVDEPHYSFNADEYFKGVKNVYLSMPVPASTMRCRIKWMLSQEEEINGVTIAPFDVAIHQPTALTKRTSTRPLIDLDTASIYGKTKACCRDACPNLPNCGEKVSLR